MKATGTERPAWRDALAKERPLILPVAHDALAARMIERAGFTAYQIGGYALSASLHAVPDVDLDHFREHSEAVERIVNASPLPVMVDADDRYGDVKNVTRTVNGYEALGVSAIFIEDQPAPKKCGHMDNKEVVPLQVMEQKLRAAVAARKDKDFFIVGRTDAIQPCGLDEALRRCERFLKAGVDGVYLEGPTSVEELKRIGREFKGVPLATSILEGGGKTPWLPPAEYGEMGFSMLLYPTSVIFRVARAIERAVDDLKQGRPMPEYDAVNMEQFLQIVEMDFWKGLEEKFEAKKG